jgi:CxxC motif-containing protein (DUF1111 family)
VQILTPIVNPASKVDKEPLDLRELDHVVKAQTGFRTSGSVVLHRFGTHPEYAEWRRMLLRKTFHAFSLRQSERNTPAVFGAGLIDAIPDAAIEEAAATRPAQFPEVQGRVSRLKDGRIGRFGWKGHTATLEDFVLTACSVELGLEVLGHHQSDDPSDSTTGANGLDLTDEECASLVAYVRALPAPVRTTLLSPAEGTDRAKGEEIFRSIGCASCHVPKLGEVDGLYSDLLLHDMGQSLSDSAAYYGSDQEIGGPQPELADASETRGRPAAEKAPSFGARSSEWRTPPLWGLRDSAPYLHDGRAATMGQAIALHGGEAGAAAHSYAQLPALEKRQLLIFLRSLATPPADRRLIAISTRRRP